jgi:hypothetical protein
MKEFERMVQRDLDEHRRDIVEGLRSLGRVLTRRADEIQKGSSVNALGEVQAGDQINRMCARHGELKSVLAMLRKTDNGSCNVSTTAGTRDTFTCAREAGHEGSHRFEK